MSGLRVTRNFFILDALEAPCAPATLDTHFAQNSIYRMNLGRSQFTDKAAARLLGRAPYCRGKI